MNSEIDFVSFENTTHVFSKHAKIILEISCLKLTLDHMRENIECLGVEFECTRIVFLLFGLVRQLSIVRRLVTIC